MAITITLPQEVEASLEARWPDLSRKATEALLVESYRQGLLSQGKIGELLGFSLDETEEFLSSHGALLHYNETDLQRDLETMKRLNLQGTIRP